MIFLCLLNFFSSNIQFVSFTPVSCSMDAVFLIYLQKLYWVTSVYLDFLVQLHVFSASIHHFIALIISPHIFYIFFGVIVSWEPHVDWLLVYFCNYILFPVPFQQEVMGSITVVCLKACLSREISMASHQEPQGVTDCYGTTFLP